MKTIIPSSVGLERNWDDDTFSVWGLAAGTLELVELASHVRIDKAIAAEQRWTGGVLAAKVACWRPRWRNA